MKPISNARIIIIAIVTLISVYYTWPTVRYYMHLSSAPEMVGRRVFSETRPPDPADVEAYAAWAEANPAAAQWIENNQAYLEWERENERLQERAIPLGLDLRGGVDITLGLNFNQIRINRTEDLKNELRNLFQVRNVSAAIVDTRPTEITVRADAADARTVAGLIKHRASANRSTAKSAPTIWLRRPRHVWPGSARPGRIGDRRPERRDAGHQRARRQPRRHAAAHRNAG